jgi:hypothetical protein
MHERPVAACDHHRLVRSSCSRKERRLLRLLDARPSNRHLHAVPEVHLERPPACIAPTRLSQGPPSRAQRLVNALTSRPWFLGPKASPLVLLQRLFRPWQHPPPLAALAREVLWRHAVHPQVHGVQHVRAALRNVILAMQLVQLAAVHMPGVHTRRGPDQGLSAIWPLKCRGLVGVQRAAFQRCIGPLLGDEEEGGRKRG